MSVQRACSVHAVPSGGKHPRARTHIVEHKVDVLVVLRTDNVQQPDDVVVATELLEVHDLTERALGVRGVAEGVETLLERYRVAGTAVHGFPHDAVGLGTTHTPT